MEATVDPQASLRDPQEFGRRISAARGWAQLSKVQFAEAMGTSVPTVRRWEAGELGSIGHAIVIRHQLAERIQAATGCPPEILGIGPDSEFTRQRNAEAHGVSGSSVTREDLAALGQAIDERLKNPESPKLDALIERLRTNDPQTLGAQRGRPDHEQD